MKTLAVFYSYTGKTKKLAENEASDIVEIKDIKRPGVLKAYTAGCFAAVKGKLWPLQPLDIDLKEYDIFILLFPVWAGNPPPVFNTFLKQLPDNKTVSIKAVSASGKSSCKERLEAFIKAKNGKLTSFEDVKA